MRIVIVEDEAIVARRIERLARKILGPKLERVEMASSLGAAVELLGRVEGAAVLLDLNLGGEDGFEVLRRAAAEPFQTIGPWPIPTINTLLLLSSGVTLTIAHHALKENRRGLLIFWLATTVGLGIVFLGFQAFEYMHAYADLNLKLSSGIFGSTFFMLTGFHGFHVCVGAIMLAVVLLRVLRGHFTPENHFAFEGAAWYWHFVDVVWLGLYVVVYWL